MPLQPQLGGHGDWRGLSNTLWGDCPTERIFGERDLSVGWGIIDDFTDWALVRALATNLGVYTSEGNTYRTFEKAGGASAQAIVPDDTVYTVPTGFPILALPGGSAVPLGAGTNQLQAAGATLWTPGQLTFTPSADNDQASLQAGPQTDTANSCPFHVYPARSGNLWFECRLKFSALATTFSTFFIGLAGSGSAITSRPCATGAFDTNTNLLGFGCLSTYASNKISLVVNKAGGTVSNQAVANMASMNILTLLGTSADTTKGYLNIGDGVYFKLGFKYDGVDKTLTPFINGVALDGMLGLNRVIGSGTLSTNLGSAAPGTGSATLWPLTGMTLCAGLFHDLTTYQTQTIDWWAVAQTPLS